MNQNIIVHNIVSKHVKAEYWKGPTNRQYVLEIPQVGIARISMEADYSEIMIWTYRPDEGKEYYDARLTKEIDGPGNLEKAKQYGEAILMQHMDVLTR